MDFIKFHLKISREKMKPLGGNFNRKYEAHYRVHWKPCYYFKFLIYSLKLKVSKYYKQNIFKSNANYHQSLYPRA